VAGNLGVIKIQELAAELEQAVRAKVGKNQIQKLAKNFLIEIKSFTAALPEKGKVIKQIEKADLDQADIDGILAELEVLLENNDTETFDLFEKSKAMLLDVLGETGKILESQIHQFDYRDALITLRSIHETDDKPKR
jgi:hypothetical protein